MASQLCVVCSALKRFCSAPPMHVPAEVTNPPTLSKLQLDWTSSNWLFLKQNSYKVKNQQTTDIYANGTQGQNFLTSLAMTTHLQDYFWIILITRFKLLSKSFFPVLEHTTSFIIGLKKVFVFKSLLMPLIHTISEMVLKTMYHLLPYIFPEPLPSGDVWPSRWCTLCMSYLKNIYKHYRSLACQIYDALIQYWPNERSK